MKIVAIFLVSILLLAPVMAETAEAPSLLSTEVHTMNYWQEFDITFWQTFPYAAFWGYAISTQMARGGEVNWSPVINITLAASLLNAALYAKRVTK